MLALEQVVSSFVLLASLDRKDAEKWRPLCRAAAYDIGIRIKPGTDMEANRQRLCEAAGALTYYRYQLKNAAGDGGIDFKAGDITVSGVSVSRLKIAAIMRDEALFCIRDLIDENRFAFISCGGKTESRQEESLCSPV